MIALGTDFDAALTRGALAVLVVAGLWSVAVVVSIALEARTGGQARFAECAGCPRVVRVWLLGLFVALFTGLAPAQASDSGSHTGSGTAPHLTGHSGEAVASALDGLPLPERLTGSPVRRAPGSSASVVVRPGDSLWRIARAGLPAAATDAEVSRAVQALYAANRRQIGPDPDRIRPGVHLDFPAPTAYPEEP